MTGGRARRVVLVGLDGLDPGVVESMWSRGELPRLGALRAQGGFARARTTTPAQTPVAWSTVATGMNPGRHGIFDFLRRDPESYLPDVSLFDFERRGAFLPPRPVNRRRGTPFWTLLNEAGHETAVLRFPGTWPPDEVDGRMLSGVGVPDLRGGFGTSIFLTPSPEKAGENEEIAALRPGGAPGEWLADLPGPRTAKGPRASVEVRLRVDADRLHVAFDGGGEEPVPFGTWSRWIQVRFRLGAFQTVRGQLRVHAVRGGDEPEVHLSPVQPWPDEPPHPISHPWGYAGDLRREIGDFHTLGMAEEHQGLNNGRLDEQAYLDQCRTVMRERRAMLFRELDRTRTGLVACVFDTPDRLQHMFWRFREPDHPSHGLHGHPGGWEEVVADHYRECDALVGEVMDALEDSDLLLVVSDHGFGSFRREVHLNTVLHELGCLHLRDGARPGEGGELPLASVDWDRTTAYALGLGGVYLNRRGRESNGIVAESEVEDVAEELAGRLRDWSDRHEFEPLRWIRPRNEVYTGNEMEDAPDLLVGTRPDTRISSATALGGLGMSTVTPNTGRWSGDHVVDPEAVPGVFFMNRSFEHDIVDLRDVAPTVLGALAVPVGGSMEGKALP